MTKKLQHGVLALLLLFGLATMAYQYQHALAQDQTVPTRTPTPGPATPVPPSPTADSGGGVPGPNPTETSPAPGATATTASGGTRATATRTTSTGKPSATTVGSQGLPAGDAAAAACAPPTLTARATVFVHSGPGVDYPVVGSLPESEARLIVGRAAFAPWWQVLFIETEPQLLGWVQDGNHLFKGNMAQVAVVEPPLLNDVAPTPGALWQPTPPPDICNATATPTATTPSTPPAAPTATAVAAATQPADSGGGAIVVQEGSAAELDTQGSTSGKQLPEGNATAPDEAAANEGTAANSGTASSRGAMTSLLVPLLGGALIIAGIVIALLSRSRPPAA